MADTITVELGSLAETEHLGRLLGEIARAGDVLLLDGRLGAGKTTLAQFIGSGLGVPEECYITSPTFSLMHEYPGRLPMYHMDLYRLSSEEEIEELGFLENIYGNGLTVIEWPDRLGSLIPGDHLGILIEFNEGEKRTLQLHPHGSDWPERTERIVSDLQR